MTFPLNICPYPLNLPIYWTHYMQICYMRALSGTHPSHITRSACIENPNQIHPINGLQSGLIIQQYPYSMNVNNFFIKKLINLRLSGL